jgi:urease accessory protein
MVDPLYRLLAWLSPAYPIGAFSYSHGIETAVEEGLIKDRASLVTWLETVLADGTGRVDGALFAAAFRATAAKDWPAFDAIAERAAAWRGTSEMALESRQQGGSFLSITRTAWPHPDLEHVRDELALPVAVALAHRGARHCAGRCPGRLPPCLHRQPDLGRGAHRAARTK